MTQLITLAQAKAHLRRDHSLDDDDITLKIEAASAAILQYVGDNQYRILDTGGDVLAFDTSTEQADLRMLHVCQQATKLLLTHWDKNRDGTGGEAVEASAGYGYLPLPVVSLLYPYRDPTIA